MQQDTDAALPDADGGPNLLVACALDVGEPDELTLFGPQRREDPRHVQPQAEVRAVGRDLRGRASFRALVPGSPPVIDHQVAGDPDEECALGRRFVGRPLDPQQPQIGFLDDVVGLGHAAHGAHHVRA